MWAVLVLVCRDELHDTKQRGGENGLFVLYFQVTVQYQGKSGQDLESQSMEQCCLLTQAQAQL